MPQRIAKQKKGLKSLKGVIPEASRIISWFSEFKRFTTIIAALRAAIGKTIATTCGRNKKINSKNTYKKNQIVINQKKNGLT